MVKREDLNFYLQNVSLKVLEDLEQEICQNVRCEILQSPSEQTLMLPVKDPISEGEFYGGEILVCTTYVQLHKDKQSSQGFAMVLDCNQGISRCIAVMDAYVGLNLGDALTQKIYNLVQQAKQEKEAQEAQRNKKVDATRVQFELM